MKKETIKILKSILPEFFPDRICRKLSAEETKTLRAERDSGISWGKLEKKYGLPKANGMNARRAYGPDVPSKSYRLPPLSEQTQRDIVIAREQDKLSWGKIEEKFKIKKAHGMNGRRAYFRAKEKFPDDLKPLQTCNSAEPIQPQLPFLLS